MKRKNSKKIFYTIIILLFLLFICISVLYAILKNQQQSESNIDISIMSASEPKTIEEIIEKYESTYINREENILYIDFAKDLFEDGKSNENYFESMIDELCEVEEFNETSFTLIDEEKIINIQVNYELRLERHVIIYNNKEDFFDTANGEIYSKVNNVEIAEKIKLITSSEELIDLISGQMYLRYIKDAIGEGIDLGNGYTSYQDGAILIKLAGSRVKSIIFTQKYTESVFSGIKVGTDLKEIEDKYEEYTEGSAQEGYIMLRTKDVYAFIYENEIIVYGYSYFENRNFEKYLEQYLDDKDFSKFVESVTNNWSNYEICEINYETQSAHITYPSRGVEIIIENNNPEKTTLYENYYFTDKTKSFVRNEQILINNTEDFLELTEKNRRNSMEN